VNAAGHLSERSWPSSRIAWYATGVLTFAYLVSFVDRQILSLLIEPIRRDLGITDTQVSLLGGFAFALLYTFAGIPIAWLADHRSRRVIIALGVTVWSAMTALCGLSKSFWQMFLARVGVGVGEASLTPSAYSMIADYFPPHQLARAMGVYMAGGAIGAGLALVVGGAVLALTADLPPMAFPLVGVLKPWQLAFFLVSLPGILVIVLMMTVKEPLRRGGIQLRAEEKGSKSVVSPRAASRYVREHWKIYLPLYAGFAVLSLMKNAILVWTPTMYIRTYGWEASSIGYVYGVCLLIFGPLGSVGGGWLADRWRARGRTDASLRVVMLAAFLCAPVAAVMPLMPEATGSLIFLATLTFLLFVIGAVTPTAFQLVTPNPLRAQVSAVALFVNNLLGIGLGPTLVALITDYGFGDDMALRYSMCIVALVFAPLGALTFWSGLKSYRAQEGR
jgi:MFS family permease